MHEGLRRVFRLTDSGILALSVIAIVQMLSLAPPLPFPLNVSLYGFAVCIPLAGLQAFILTLEAEPDLIKNSLGITAHVLITAFAGLFFYLGILYMFAYFSLGASIVFAVVSSVPYGLSFLMSVAGKKRYLYAAGSTVTLLFYNAFMLSAGYWPNHIFYDSLQRLP